MSGRLQLAAALAASSILVVTVANAATDAPMFPETTQLALDSETTINGVEVACTGIGQTRADPHWQSYPIRVEFSNAANEYLGGGQIVLSDARGRPLLAVACDAPWILLKPAAGAYSVRGRPVDGAAAAPRSATFRIPVKSQTRLVLQFPDA